MERQLQQQQVHQSARTTKPFAGADTINTSRNCANSRTAATRLHPWTSRIAPLPEIKKCTNEPEPWRPSASRSTFAC
jgi:hypothetical protein